MPFEVFLGKLENIIFLDHHGLCAVNSHNLRPFFLYALESTYIHSEKRQRLVFSEVGVEQARVYSRLDCFIQCTNAVRRQEQYSRIVFESPQKD